jgi:hypothetical protein
MQSPHFEDEGFDSHLILTSEFSNIRTAAASTMAAGGGGKLRIYLEQPSPVWKKNDITEIRLLTRSAVMNMNEEHVRNTRLDDGSFAALIAMMESGGGGSIGASSLSSWSSVQVSPRTGMQIVGHAGASLRRDNSNGSTDLSSSLPDERQQNADSQDGGEKEDGSNSLLPGYKLDALYHELQLQIASLRSVDYMHNNQASAFLEMSDNENAHRNNNGSQNYSS